VIDALVAEVNGEGDIRQSITPHPQKATEQPPPHPQPHKPHPADRFLDGFEREEGV
jgi:hypothetical protein